MIKLLIKPDDNPALNQLPSVGGCGVHVANHISPTIQKLKTFFCRAKTKTNTVNDSKLNSCGSGTGMTGAGNAITRIAYQWPRTQLSCTQC